MSLSKPSAEINLSPFESKQQNQLYSEEFPFGRLLASFFEFISILWAQETRK